MYFSSYWKLKPLLMLVKVSSPSALAVGTGVAVGSRVSGLGVGLGSAWVWASSRETSAAGVSVGAAVCSSWLHAARLSTISTARTAAAMASRRYKFFFIISTSQVKLMCFTAFVCIYS